VPKSDPEPVTAVWVRTAGPKDSGYIETLAEIDGAWRLIARDYLGPRDNEIGHIIEGRSFRGAPADPLEAR
jgi:hypothetical protein